MTHYGSSGHPSRMRSPGLSGGRLAFTYLDAANVASAEDERMTGLVLGLGGPDALVHEWTSLAAGREHVGRFELTRKR
jgi:hypothetical protein